MNTFHSQGTIRGTFNAELKCDLLAVVLAGDEVHFIVPPLNCTDMTGAINLAQRLAPGVTTIRTFEGDRVGVRYRLDDSIWAAFRPTDDTRWMVATPMLSIIKVLTGRSMVESDPTYFDPLALPEGWPDPRQ